MSATIDDLTVDYEEDGIKTVEQLDKEVLSKGAWTTILYRFHEWDKKNSCYGPDKYTIRRYQKRNNEYWQKSKFNISSRDQANKIIKVLQGWVELDDEAGKAE